jgi:hypothetical protein
MAGLIRTDDGFLLWREASDIFENFEDDEDSVSVFVGVCKSKELFVEYWRDEVLAYDFGFCYDEDFACIKFREKPTRDIDTLFDDADIFDLDELKKQYPGGLDQAYNAVYVVGNVKYSGIVKEFENEAFGYFKFLGVFKPYDAFFGASLS